MRFGSAALALAYAAAAAASGCGGHSRSVASAPEVRPGPDAAAAPAPPADVDGRLPATATPERYTVALRIDPSKQRFSGSVSIQVSMTEPTWHVVLHARDLHVTRATALVGLAGSRPLAATVSPRRAADALAAEELVLTFAEPLPAGKAVVDVDYDAPFGAELSGLYRVEEDGRSYVFSQFEATDARRAMPCFDEPGYKTPFEVTIAAPRGAMALTNAPEVATEDGADGWVVHRFAPTPPLPSYLVAFAVGDFDLAEGAKTPVPIRVVTTKGHGGQAASALETADALVSRLGEYFDLPYPFAKLDLVAVPDFAVGAMENPGLLMFRDSLLLQGPRGPTTGLRRAQAVTIAHELAHQWFGDLVTMRWWDDLWLNEGFATWAEAMVVDAWKPAFGATLGQVAGLGHVMDEDALASARAVRQPVRSTEEAKQAFDGLTYDKGAAVLRMIEGWLGPETFRRGVQRYVHENAWKNARADDLFRALDYVSAERVGQFASAFLDRPGVPEVLARVICSGGKTRLELRQGQWHPLGDPGKPGQEAATWTLPVCVATEGRKGKACFTVGAEPIARELGPVCPGWVYPNADQSGYYRFVLDRAHLLALARAGRSLEPIQRLGLVSNAWAAVRAGAIEPSALLDALRALDGEDNRLVLGEIMSVLRSIDDTLVVEPARARYRRYVAARLGARKRALGWESAVAARGGPSPAARPDDDERVLERQGVLLTMGEIAGDEATLAEADVYARKWLEAPGSVPSDVAAVAVPMASARAGQDRLDALRVALKRVASTQDRAIVLRAMGSFDDPAVLAQGLDVTLTGDVRLSELRHVFGAASHRAGRPAFYAWVKSRWAKLDERLPPSFGRAQLVSLAGSMCTAPEREEARAFFAEATKGVEGAARSLEQAVEGSGQCVALRERGAADVARYLAAGL